MIWYTSKCGNEKGEHCPSSRRVCETCNDHTAKHLKKEADYAKVKNDDTFPRSQPSCLQEFFCPRRTNNCRFCLSWSVIIGNYSDILWNQDRKVWALNPCRFTPSVYSLTSENNPSIASTFQQLCSNISLYSSIHEWWQLDRPSLYDNAWRIIFHIFDRQQC